MSVERGTGKLCPDDATALPSDHLFELSVEREPLTIGKLTQGIPSPQ